MFHGRIEARQLSKCLCKDQRAGATLAVLVHWIMSHFPYYLGKWTETAAHLHSDMDRMWD